MATHAFRTHLETGANGRRGLEPGYYASTVHNGRHYMAGPQGSDIEAAKALGALLRSQGVTGTAAIERAETAWEYTAGRKRSKGNARPQTSQNAGAGTWRKPRFDRYNPKAAAFAR